MKADEDQARAVARTHLERGIRNALFTFLLASALSLTLLFVVSYFDHKGRRELRLNAHWLTTTLRKHRRCGHRHRRPRPGHFLNPVAEALTGWSAEEASGKPLDDVFRIVNEETGQPVESPSGRSSATGASSAWPTTRCSSPRTGPSGPSTTVPPRSATSEAASCGVVLVFRRHHGRKRRGRAADQRGGEEVTARVVRRRRIGLRRRRAIHLERNRAGRDAPRVPRRAKTVGSASSRCSCHPEPRGPWRGSSADSPRREGTSYETRHRREGRLVNARLAHYLERAVTAPRRHGSHPDASGSSRDITEQRRGRGGASSCYRSAPRDDRARTSSWRCSPTSSGTRSPPSATPSSSRSARRPGADLEWSKEVIDRQVKHLARLIDDLLDVSRITRGKIRAPQGDALDLAPILDQAVETVRPLLDERKHELTVSIAPGTSAARGRPDPARADPRQPAHQRRQVHRRRGPHLAHRRTERATTSSSRSATPASASRPRCCPQMFDLFAQGDRSLARSEGGLGIGLTLVQKLAEMHGGSVTATSDGPGKGSEFSVRLPRWPAAGQGETPRRAASRSPRRGPHPRRR